VKELLGKKNLENRPAEIREIFKHMDSGLLFLYALAVARMIKPSENMMKPVLQSIIPVTANTFQYLSATL